MKPSKGVYNYKMIPGTLLYSITKQAESTQFITILNNALKNWHAHSKMPENIIKCVQVYIIENGVNADDKENFYAAQKKLIRIAISKNNTTEIERLIQIFAQAKNEEINGRVLEAVTEIIKKDLASESGHLKNNKKLMNDILKIIQDNFQEFFSDLNTQIVINKDEDKDSKPEEEEEEVKVKDNAETEDKSDINISVQKTGGIAKNYDELCQLLTNHIKTKVVTFNPEIEYISSPNAPSPQILVLGSNEDNEHTDN